MKNNLLAIAMLILPALIGCGNHQSTQQSAAYPAIIVDTCACTLYTEYSARLRGCQMVDIRPQVGGIITDILIEEGQNVHQGQALFIIDQVPYQAALDQAQANVQSAEAQLATAQLNLESTRQLRSQGVVQDYDVSTAINQVAAAQAAVAQAQAQLTSARNDLSYTVVKSPVDGIAGMINYRIGALVSSSITEPLVTVSDDSRMYAYFSVSESQAVDMVAQYGSLQAFIEQMPTVKLRMANGAEYAEEGHISAVSGIVSEGTGAVTLRADFPNTGRLLSAGGSGVVIVPTVLDNCIIIPQSATYELQSKTFVYKVINDTTRAAEVQLLRINNGSDYVVQGGLNVGDTIISDGAGLLSDHLAVQLSIAQQ